MESTARIPPVRAWTLRASTIWDQLTVAQRETRQTLTEFDGTAFSGGVQRRLDPAQRRSRRGIGIVEFDDGLANRCQARQGRDGIGSDVQHSPCR